MNAVCHRCGSTKTGAFLSCSDCDYAPRGTDRAIAWLFSSGHLNEDELKLAAARVRGGELPDPSAILRSHARAMVGRGGAPAHHDIPLEVSEIVAIVLANLLLTPLAGLALWWGLKPVRPAAARQIMRVTAPIFVLLGIGWSALVIHRLFG